MTPNRPPRRRGARAETAAQIVIMLAIGGAAGAASFTHVHDLAAAHRQGGWLAWADAIVLELMSIAAGLEIRRRRRIHARLGMPAAVLTCAVSLSLAAQVIQAEPTPIGWIAAAVPAAGFLTMVKIALGYHTTADTGGVPSAADDTTPSVPDRTVPAPTANPTWARSVAPAIRNRDTTVSALRVPLPAVAGTAVTAAGGTLPEPAGMPDSAVTTVSPDSSRERDGDTDDVTTLLPAARHAATAIVASGEPLSRDRLVTALREAGYKLSNARGGTLLTHLEHETSPATATADTPAPPA